MLRLLRLTNASAPDLRVLRRAPEGEAPTTARLAVTFSQPMVVLGTSTEVEAVTRPVRLSPEPPGVWRWTGSDTLQFEPKGGFPPGRSYTVEIARGTRSAVGGELHASQRWTFRTPVARVVEFYPRLEEKQRLPLQPLFAVVVDQESNPAELLSRIELRAAGRVLPLRALDEREARGVRRAGLDVQGRGGERPPPGVSRGRAASVGRGGGGDRAPSRE